MKSPTEKRKNGRVQFSRGVSARIVAIDGTWAKSCKMIDVAQNGAKLRISDTAENLKLKEFFLVLSTTGTAYRHCSLAWINGDQIGVHFLAKEEKPRKTGVRFNPTE